MNKIFRIVWSQATQSWVAVSELTKAHKKQSASNAQKSAVKFSGNFIKSSAVALALLSGHSAYAVVNEPGTGSDTNVAWGQSSNASGNNAVAVGKESKATQNNAVAVGRKAQATGDSAIALGIDSKSTSDQSVAVGVLAQATDKQAVAVGYKSQATGVNSISIGNTSAASGNNSIALGSNTKATGATSVALGTGSNATGNDSYALGWGSNASAEKSMALGHSSKARKVNDIAFGREAETRDQGSGHSVAIGAGAVSGSNKGVLNRSGDDAGGVAIGTGAFTGVNRDSAISINSSVAVGAGAGAGFRSLDPNKMPAGNATDVDTNDEVLKKAFGVKDVNTDFQRIAGGTNGYTNVDINEATALGRNARAIGDQSVAIGAQTIAGMGAIALGGNDITQFADKKYYKSTKENFKVTETEDHNQDANISNDTISGAYARLVGTPLDKKYKATYAQDGSVVLGAQAHSGTPLGTAIGTNALVRKGAFGATAIGAGSQIQANAEAAVAIGMGALANGKYAVAAGTAAKAEESAVAAGYKANADKSAVAVGDHSNATTSSVAVGQGAQATKEADIAVGQGAKASGEQGAIAMGLGTQAQGDSSIMIGGSEITKVASQKVSYQKEKKDAQKRTVIKTTKKIETIGGEQVERTIRSVEMENATGTIQQAYGELTNGATLNIDKLDYSLAANKNGHGSISMGIHSLSTGDLGTAIGTGARVTKLGGVALGTGAVSELQNGVAIGTGSRADDKSIGTRQTDISYDEEGHIVPFDSKKVAYTFYWAGGTNTSEGDVVSFGTPGAERQLKNVAAGRIADDSTDAINGSQLNSVTKRMSSGWAVEAEKDKDSSGVLKLKGTEATAGTEVHSADGKTTTRENPGTATGKVDKVRLNDEVKIRVGDNLVLNQEDATRDAYEDPDNPNRKTGTHVTSKFTYSLNPVLSNLTSAEFKGTDANAPTTMLTNAGVTITPATSTGKKPVSLTENGLNNGGNPITNVAGNLDGAKTGTTEPTTKADKPNNVNDIKNNAATVGDVLNAGWNLQEKGTAKDFVTAYDTVNFVDGDGTSVSVTNTDGKTSTIKYSANLGDGLEKTNDNKIKVKAADNTLTTDANGLKVNTGTINPVDSGDKAGTVAVNTDDAGKIATVDTVVNAVNNAAWTATSAATTAGELGKEATNQLVKAGDKVTFEADKNIKITQNAGKFTFATKDNVSFDTVQIGGSEGPKFAKATDGSIKVSDKDGKEPVKITNVKDGDISANSKDAINGSQFHKVANNTIQLKGQNGTDTATETKKQALNKEDGIAFTVKSSDGTLLDVAASGDTITLTPKTGTITTTNGVPTANTTGGKLVTADQLVNALTEMGWKATADKDGTGTVEGNAEELIKAGEKVTFKAGNNLAIKQAGKEFIYSLNPVLSGLTSAEFKNQAGDKTVINSDGMTITPKDAPANPVSLTKDGLDNGGKTIKNVTSGLTNYAEGKPKDGLVNLSKPATGTPAVPDTTAATVGDLRNMGWVVSSDKTTGDLTKAYTDQVKNADEVKFVGEGGVTVSGKTENGIRTITVKAEAQEMPEQPVSYTTAEGTKVYPKTVVKPDGSKEVKYYSEPDGKGTEIAKDKVITSVNGPEGTTAPTTLSNVAGNLDGAKANTQAPTTNAAAPNTTDKNGDKYINPNNAATVGDVLNAGWNLQNNGEARDFVKPYDTVNFVDGLNTKAVVTTDAEGKVSNVQIDVKDLPIAYTNEAGDKVVKAA
ncbi:MAG: ESPR-type extended signal peptide-containing protein, partial [Haemophilus haemolyticus]|nr:ESPR-type extended signal peptide-containing protein [Haemophilus haemolyticus]